MSVWDFLDKLTPLLMGPVCLISQGWFEEPVRPWAGSGRLSVQADSLRNGKSPEQPYTSPFITQLVKQPFAHRKTLSAQVQVCVFFQAAGTWRTRIFSRCGHRPAPSPAPEKN